MRRCSAMSYHIGVVGKIRLNYNKKRLVAVNAGAERSVYNLLVSANNEIYQLRKTADLVPAYRNRIDYLRSVIASPATIKTALPYLNTVDVDCQTVANGIRNYAAAWKNMRERHTGVPTFHKKSSTLVWNTNCHYKAGDTGINDGSIRFTDSHHIILPKIGSVRFEGSPKLIRALLDDPEDTRIGTVTIRKDVVGEYWASLQISSEHPLRPLMEKTGTMTGIDLNLIALVCDSEGGIVVNPRFHRKMEPAIAKVQRSMSRKRERAKAEGCSLASSRNYQKDRVKYAKLYRRAARQRDDYLNRISHDLVENQDLIAAEDLKVKNLLKNHKLAKSISDAGWRILLTQLQQKAAMYDKTVILVPPHYTTQKCSVCGYVMKGEEHLTLTDREWTCPNCGTHHDRDTNAAVNVLDRALQMLTEVF